MLTRCCCRAALASWALMGVGVGEGTGVHVAVGIGVGVATTDTAAGVGVGEGDGLAVARTAGRGVAELAAAKRVANEITPEGTGSTGIGVAVGAGLDNAVGAPGASVRSASTVAWTFKATSESTSCAAIAVGGGRAALIAAWTVASILGSGCSGAVPQASAIAAPRAATAASRRLRRPGSRPLSPGMTWRLYQCSRYTRYVPGRRPWSGPGSPNAIRRGAVWAYFSLRLQGRFAWNA